MQITVQALHFLPEQVEVPLLDQIMVVYLHNQTRLGITFKYHKTELLILVLVELEEAMLTLFSGDHLLPQQEIAVT